MADDLRDSPFLGSRIINFVQSIVRSPSRGSSGTGLSPVTGFEQKLLKHQEEIVSINKELEGKLIDLLQRAKDYMPPHTAMRLLLYGQSKGFLRGAHQIVHYAARDRLVLTDEEINEIVAELRRDPEAEAQWLMILYSGKKEEVPEPVSNSIKLPIDFT